MIKKGIDEINGNLSKFDSFEIAFQDTQWAGAILGKKLKSPESGPDGNSIENYTNYYYDCIQRCCKEGNHYPLDLISFYARQALDFGDGNDHSDSALKKMFIVNLKQLQRYRGWALASGDIKRYQQLSATYKDFVDIFNEATNRKISIGDGLRDQYRESINNSKFITETMRKDSSSLSSYGLDWTTWAKIGKSYSSAAQSVYLALSKLDAYDIEPEALRTFLLRFMRYRVLTIG